jgi:hypothetical protein
MEPSSHLLSESALEARARRAAKRLDLIAKKTRWRAGSVDNYGGFMLVDLWTNAVVAGHRFDMSAEEVLAYCAQD